MAEEKNVDNSDFDTDTENEELEANETDYAPDTTESETDAEAEQVEDDGADEQDADSDDRNDARSRAKAQIDRLKEEVRRLKAEKSNEKGDKEGGSQASVASSELVSRTYLATKGYDNEAVQDKAIDRAERLGMTVDQLLRDPDEKAVLDAAVKRMTTKAATSRPTGKGGTRTKDAKWYADNNVMPEDPELVAEVWKLLADRDR